MSDRADPRAADIPAPALERVVAEVEGAAPCLCALGVSQERLRAAAAQAMARAFQPCLQGTCASCDHEWSGSGVSCEERQVRRLGKQLVQALLPVMRRGCGLPQAWPILLEASARVVRDGRPLAAGEGGG